MKLNQELTPEVQKLLLATEELRKTKVELIRISRLYAFISQINQRIVRINDQETLFQNACEMALEFGKFEMAWIGIFDKKKKTFSQIYQCGVLKEDINSFIHSRDKNIDSQEYVLQTGQYFISNNIENALGHQKRDTGTVSNTIHSSIVLPVKKAGMIIGTFNLYSAEPNFSNEEEIKLLLELTRDISFALDLFEKENIHKEMIKEQGISKIRIEESESRYRAFFENSMDGILLTIADGEIISVNPAACEMFRMSEQEICDSGRYGLVDLSDPRANELITKRQTTGKAKGELTFMRKDRSKFPGEISSVLFHDSSGEKKTSMIIRDISDRKEAEKQKDFEKNNLNALINNTNDLMWSVDRDYKLITSNIPFEESIKLMLGGSIIEKGNSVFFDGFTDDQIKKYKNIYDRAFSGETFSELEHGDSPKEYWLEISYYPIRNEDKIVGVACHSRDVTKIKVAELEREKMISEIIQHSKNLEQFAHIVSHNLRGPIVNILGLSNVLKGKTSEAEKRLVQQYIFTAVGQLDEVVIDLNKILLIKSQITETKENISLKKMVEDIQFSIRSLIEKEEALIYCDFSMLSQIKTIKSYLHSIFYNLISNSIKYKHSKRPPVIQINSDLINGKIQITFKDNGSGIDLNMQKDKIFGLYKRFHENIEGKGFGLFMVKTQVEALGGNITVKSAPDEGTEFIILLPT